VPPEDVAAYRPRIARRCPGPPAGGAGVGGAFLRPRHRAVQPDRDAERDVLAVHRERPTRRQWDALSAERPSPSSSWKKT
jgi:hypothetical protein